MCEEFGYPSEFKIADAENLLELQPEMLRLLLFHKRLACPALCFQHFLTRQGHLFDREQL